MINIRDYKITDHEYASAGIHLMKMDNEHCNIGMDSYSTCVISGTIFEVKGSMYIECSVHGLYSRTTIKHISWFMKEVFNDNYFTAKRAYEYKEHFMLSVSKKWTENIRAFCKEYGITLKD